MRRLVLLVVAGGTAGCGSAPTGELPPPAGPARSPALTRPPAGEVIRADAYAPEPAVAKAAGRTFAADEHADTVTVREDGRRVATLRVPGRPGALAVAEGGRVIAVVARRARAVEAFDARTLRRTGRVATGVGPTNLASDGGRMLYVADTAGDGLAVLRTRPRLAVTRRVAFPGGAPYGVAVDRRRGRIWVTLTATNELAELAAGAKPRVLRRFPAVRQPDAVAVDERTGRVVVHGRAEGVLQVLEPRAR